MAKNIKGNHDSPKGGNDSYTIPGRGTVPRKQLVREVESGVFCPKRQKIPFGEMVS